MDPQFFLNAYLEKSYGSESAAPMAIFDVRVRPKSEKVKTFEVTTLFLSWSRGDSCSSEPLDSRAELFFEYKFDFAEIFVKKNQHLKEHSKKIFNFQFFYFE